MVNKKETPKKVAPKKEAPIILNLQHGLDRAEFFGAEFVKFYGDKEQIPLLIAGINQIRRLLAALVQVNPDAVRAYTDGAYDPLQDTDEKFKLKIGDKAQLKFAAEQFEKSREAQAERQKNLKIESEETRAPLGMGSSSDIMGEGIKKEEIDYT